MAQIENKVNLLHRRRTTIIMCLGIKLLTIFRKLQPPNIKLVKIMIWSPKTLRTIVILVILIIKPATYKSKQQLIKTRQISIKINPMCIKINPMCIKISPMCIKINPMCIKTKRWTTLKQKQLISIIRQKILKTYHQNNLPTNKQNVQNYKRN